MNGYLNMLKPPGMTSAGMVAFVRHITGEKHVGHAGTLDPDACGVLPVMIGRAARLFDYLVDKEKTYVAEAAFGQATDTQDAGGRVIAEGTNYPDRAAVEAAALKLTGDIVQRPGMYSAIKKDGVPMYKLAFRGETAEVPERIVHVERIRVLEEMENHGFLIRVDCGRGTYIRSICEDMGKLTGCPAHMRFLLRAKSGAFDLSTAVTREEAEHYAQEGTLAQHLLKPDWPLQHLPRYDAPANLEKQVRNGVALPARSEWEEGKHVRIYLNDRFWGIAAREGEVLRWRTLISPES